MTEIENTIQQIMDAANEAQAALDRRDAEIQTKIDEIENIGFERDLTDAENERIADLRKDQDAIGDATVKLSLLTAEKLRALK